eukprot:scaffold24258_cov47-Attheya_sp.AAC.9
MDIRMFLRNLDYSGIGSTSSERNTVNSKKKKTHHCPLINASNWKQSDLNSNVTYIEINDFKN